MRKAKKVYTVMLAVIMSIFVTSCALSGSVKQDSESQVNTGTIEAESKGSTLETGTTGEKFILFNEAVLSKLKNGTDTPEEIKKYLDKIRKSANSYLNKEPVSVTQKTSLTGSAELHDYVSMAVYYWPDTSKENGLPYISKDGQVNPEKNDETKFDSSRLSKMISTVKTLSLEYYLSGEERYANQATRFLTTWFLNSDTKMNPNLEYGQCIPGQQTGRYFGIIDTAALIPLIDSVTMLEGSESWTEKDSTGLKQWFSDYVDWLQQSKFGQKESETTNNHAVWYDAQVACFAYYAGRLDVASSVLEQTVDKRIKTQIQSDGSMPKELSRTRSMDYTMYNLEAFTTLAQLGKVVGLDLWNYTTEDGKSIRQAYEFLSPYLIDNSGWQYQNVVQENSNSFAPYLAMAAKAFHSSEYASISTKLVLSSDIRGELMIYSYLDEFR